MFKAALAGILIVVTGMAAGISWWCPNPVAHDDSVQVAGETKVHEDSRAKALFRNRIMPIFRSPDPSSCVQCHLSSVDLKNYILPSHQKTFLSLRDQGLINLENPASSKILQLIRMGDKDDDANARLIHADMRKAELEAFTAWIEACCEDKELMALPPLDESEYARPPVPDEVIRHGRKSRVVDSFVRNIWSQRMRCFPCHTPHEIGPNQKKAREKFDDWYGQFGDRILIFKETPEATLDYLVEQSREGPDDELPLLNLESPTESLLVLKPTSKIPPEKDGYRAPTYQKPIYHIGGLKMHKDDHSYKSFVAWIQDYAAVTAGRYQTVDALPADNWFPTRKVIRLKEIPDTWPVGSAVQFFVYAKAQTDTGWTEHPVAFTQGTITPRRIANGPLILLGPKNRDDTVSVHERRPHLPAGDYRVKVYLDSENIILQEPTAFLTEDDFRGEAVLKNHRWRIGFKNATWMSGKEFQP